MAGLAIRAVRMTREKGDVAPILTAEGQQEFVEGLNRSTMPDEMRRLAIG